MICRRHGVLAALVFGAMGALAAPVAGAQTVTLQVHPHVGDTLRTRLEQQTVMTAAAHDAGGKAKSVMTSVTLDSRTVAQSSLATSTLVLTIVDSVDIHTTDARGAAQVADTERRLRGQRFLLRLATDGSVESARDARGFPVSHEMAEAFAAMPAVFPRRAVRVGEQWTREMPLPAGGPLGARGSAQVRALFRLDSLGRHGNPDIAFVSMHGQILPDSADMGVELSGEISGAMRVDRRRGWLTDSHFVVLVRSLIHPPPASGLAPMLFVTKVTQRLHTVDKR